MKSTVCSLLAIGLCALCAVSLAAADPDIRSLLDGGHFKQARALLEPRVKAPTHSTPKPPPRSRVSASSTARWTRRCSSPKRRSG